MHARGLNDSSKLQQCFELPTISHLIFNNVIVWESPQWGTSPLFSWQTTTLHRSRHLVRSIDFSLLLLHKSEPQILKQAPFQSPGSGLKATGLLQSGPLTQLCLKIGSYRISNIFQITSFKIKPFIYVLTFYLSSSTMCYVFYVFIWLWHFYVMLLFVINFIYWMLFNSDANYSFVKHFVTLF